MTTQQDQTLKTQFIELTFNKEWKKKLDKTPKPYRDAELIEYCLNKAWLDAIIYVKKKKNPPSDSTILANAKEIKKRLYTDLTASAWGEDFDTWHDNICSDTDFGMRYGV